MSVVTAQMLVDNAELVRGLMPQEHCRTSCSDDKLVNAIGSASDGGARCMRCAFLHVLENPGQYDKLSMTFRLHKEVEDDEIIEED